MERNGVSYPYDPEFLIENLKITVNAPSESSSSE